MVGTRRTFVERPTPTTAALMGISVPRLAVEDSKWTLAECGDNHALAIWASRSLRRGQREPLILPRTRADRAPRHVGAASVRFRHRSRLALRLDAGRARPRRRYRRSPSRRAIAMSSAFDPSAAYVPVASGSMPAPTLPPPPVPASRKTSRADTAEPNGEPKAKRKRNRQVRLVVHSASC